MGGKGFLTLVRQRENQLEIIHPSIHPSFSQSVSHECPQGAMLVGENCINSQEDDVLEKNTDAIRGGFSLSRCYEGKSKEPSPAPAL